LVGSIAVAALALLKASKWRRLQATLDKERKFYEERARRVTLEPIRLPEESVMDIYLDSIQSELLANAQLSDEQRVKLRYELCHSN
jgi:hypothetical protein